MSKQSLPSSAPSIQRSALQTKSMSSARLEKKRRTDRESQRAGRERTRNYILHLEKLVESLEKGPGDDRVGTLIQQCQQLREQNERLKAAVANIGRLAGSVDLSDITRDGLTDSTASPRGAASSTVNGSTGDQQRSVDAASVTENVIPSVPRCNPSLWVQSCSPFEGQQRQEPKSPILLTGSSLPNERNTTATSSAQAQTPVMNPRVADISGAAPTWENNDINIFDLVNDLLTMAELFTAISTTPGEDVDIAIRAVMNGWDVIAQRHTLDQGWDVLRQIDKKIFYSCGSIERLAILLIIRLKLRVGQFPVHDSTDPVLIVCKACTLSECGASQANAPVHASKVWMPDTHFLFNKLMLELDPCKMLFSIKVYMIICHGKTSLSLCSMTRY